jgi:hypothetical protein
MFWKGAIMEREIKHCPYCVGKVELRKLSDGYYYIELYYCEHCKVYFQVVTYEVRG